MPASRHSPDWLTQNLSHPDDELAFLPVLYAGVALRVARKGRTVVQPDVVSPVASEVSWK